MWVAVKGRDMEGGIDRQRQRTAHLTQRLDGEVSLAPAEFADT